MKRAVTTMAGAALALSALGCGSEPQKAATTATQAKQPQRGVATVVAKLAPLCVDRVMSGQQGQPTTPEVAALVDGLVAAYEAGPKNEATKGFMRVAVDNLSDGCGPDRADRVRAALEAAGESASASGSAPAEPKPAGKEDVKCDYLLGDGYRFVAGGIVRNTGEVPLVARVTVRWELLGEDPLRKTKEYAVPAGRERNVKINMPATQDEIDAHQSADGDCRVSVKIVG